MASRAPLGMNPEGRALRAWLKPYAHRLALGFLAEQFKWHPCREKIAAIAAELAARAKFERPADEYVDFDSVLSEEIDAINGRIDAVSADIAADIRPMLRALAPENFILAAAHEVNGLAGFVIAEKDVFPRVVEPLFIEFLRATKALPRPQSWRKRHVG